SVSIGYPFERKENSEPIIDPGNRPLSILSSQLFIPQGIGDVDPRRPPGRDPRGEQDRQGRKADDGREVRRPDEEGNERDEIDLRDAGREGEQVKDGRGAADEPSQQDPGDDAGAPEKGPEQEEHAREETG